MFIKSHGLKLIWVIFSILFSCIELYSSTNELLSSDSSTNYILNDIKTFKDSYPDSALSILNSINPNIKTTNEEKAWIKYLTIDCQLRTWKLDEARSNAIESVSLGKYVKDYDFKINLFYTLAQIYEYTSNPEIGMEYYYKCYSLANERNDILWLAKLDTKLGHVNRVGGNFTKAIQLFNSASDRLNLNSPQHIYEYHRAKYYAAYVVLNNLKSANDWQIRHTCEELEHLMNLIADDPNEKARYLSYKNLKINCDLTLKNAESLKSIPLLTIEEQENITTEAFTLFENLELYAKLAIRTNKLKIAENYVNRMNDIALELDNVPFQIVSLELLNQILKSSGQDQERTAYLDLLACLKDEMQFANRESSVNNLITQLTEDLAAAKKQGEIDLLKTRNIYLTLSTIVFSLLAIIIMLLFRKLNRTSEELKLKNVALDRSNENKDRLFTIIAHDLRKPALAFRGVTDKVNYLIQKKEFELLDKLGQSLEKSSAQLNALLDNLLKWALSQKDMINVKNQSFKINDVINDLLGTFDLIASEKGVSINTEGIKKEIELYNDPDILKTILRNLIDNSIKYSKSDSTVYLETHKENDQIWIKVKDSGIGMSTKQLEKLFDVDKDKTTLGTKGERGSGLGLNLIQELVEKSGGDIRCNSKIGIGTEFELVY